jgi:hypothetical protein
MYAEFYGLAAPAFQLTPDVRFFFESACTAEQWPIWFQKSPLVDPGCQ